MVDAIEKLQAAIAKSAEENTAKASTSADPKSNDPSSLAEETHAALQDNTGDACDRATVDINIADETEPLANADSNPLLSKEAQQLEEDIAGNAKHTETEPEKKSQGEHVLSFCPCPKSDLPKGWRV